MTARERIRKDLESSIEKKKQQRSKLEEIDDWMVTTYIEKCKEFREFEENIFSDYGHLGEDGLRHITMKDLPLSLTRIWLDKNEEHKNLQNLYSKYARSIASRVREKVELTREIDELNNILYYNYRD